MNTTPTQAPSDENAGGGHQDGNAAKPNSNSDHFSYMISPREESAGGGWRLQCFQNGQDVKGAAFPACEGRAEDQAYLDAMGEGEEWLLSKALQQIAPAAPVQAGEQVARFDRVTPQADGSFRHFYQGQPVAGPGSAAPPVSGAASGQPQRAVQWTLADAIEAVKRAQAFPGWDRLPQPLRSEIDTAAYLLARIEHAAADAASIDAERWREALMHVGGEIRGGRPRFTLGYLQPIPQARIMQGSIAEHFTRTIDAAKERRAAAKGAAGQEGGAA